jgi:hypothetical protein
MALIGEVTGKRVIKCEDCKKIMHIEILRSNAGYYIGFCCPECGPYSRESGYYKKATEAAKALEENTFER